MKNVLFVLFTVPFLAFAENPIECDTTCTFILKNAKQGDYQTSNQSRSNQRYSPFSTFKIPNSLISLETGVVKDLSQPLSFDRERYPIEGWWRKTWYQAPLTLKQAFEVSAVPIYQQIAYQVGAERMSELVSGFDYGNKDITSGIDSFWLNGSTRISAKEQVEFLQRLNEGRLPVSKQALKKFKDVMRTEQNDSYVLYAKTGAGRISKEKVLGWYVGFVESDSGTHYFAFNIEADTFTEMGKKRITMARQFLKQAGVI